MTRAIAAAGAALAIALVGAETAQACSCVRPDLPTALEQADGAFVGRLVAVRVEIRPPTCIESAGSTTADRAYDAGAG